MPSATETVERLLHTYGPALGVLAPVLLIPIELDEKLDPLDLLPLLLELLDDGPDAEMLGPVPLPPVFEKPGPELELCGPNRGLEARSDRAPDRTNL